MSHLFDKRIVEAFGPLLGEVATEALPAAVKDALATPGLGDYLARTIEKDVETFAHDELGLPRPLRFSDEFAFFDDYLRIAYEAGGMSQGKGWCARWWDHRSARFRVRAMWQAYEALAVRDPATCDEVFLRTVGDHHMALLMGERSPMYACQTSHQPSKPLKSEPVEGAPK
ncbi:MULTISPECIES: DUF4913 domain-containing protein [Dietzia]|jgi:hypothetical protein|uniref:Uncharacterized protein DUF4913 n=1 Tax=Dietzia cinnamea TaxID=321318 RepID=A0A4R3ZQJ1_9ACTN|nr:MULTISPECIES: DUF4913 domain-containing protein [Dietzia]MCT2107909.1 DUF4913 domain-containing protein [Dietzia cinnamea]OFS27556.1 hypothetical protein HMPREF3086_02170 [Dietzia sp. HMSC21D01]TCW21378.1 uncharacterized protein DUF4913 [Dietzia cinnamea]